MRRLALALAILLAAAVPAVACYYQTVVTPDGQYVTCSTCGSLTTCY